MKQRVEPKRQHGKGEQRGKRKISRQDGEGDRGSISKKDIMHIQEAEGVALDTSKCV